MNTEQVRIPVPKVVPSARYSFVYLLYLRCISWLLRKVVASYTGSGELFTKEVYVDTPGLGEGRVKCSICLPKDAVDSPLPLVLVFEGGGFILGQPSDGERNDRLLSDKLNAAVVSVDYAKSPEYPFPHALLQAYTVLQWCLSSSGTTQLGVAIDRRRVAVMGNSAGGNLTASLTLLNAFTKGPCKQFRDGLPKDFRQVAQVLLYPSVACNQLYRVRMANASPQAQAKSLPVWMAEMMEACYLPPGIEKDQIFIAPLLASSSLLKELQPKVPPVSCHVAGLDCLQDEAVQYCRHLEMAGVQVELKEYPEANHGFSHYKEDNKEFCKQDVEECWESVLGFLERAFKH